MLLPSRPVPADAGAKIRNAGLVGLLREVHDVDVLAFGDAPARRPANRVRDLVSSNLPDMAQRLWSRDFLEALRNRLHGRQYNAVQAEGVEMARYLGRVPPEQCIYDAHNAEFLLQERLSGSGSPLGRLYSRLQARRLARFEGTVVRRSRMTTAVSEHDANQLLALAGGAANVRVIPNAIEVADYPFRAPTGQMQANLLFVGKLDYRPNAEALSWFLREVLPDLDARLFAVGASPPGGLVRHGQHDSRVAVTGYVADERPYFARCAALVLPVRTGGGSRLKALVAMASGLPIVSTRLGMEGLEAEAGIHFIQADSAAEWRDSLQRVLGDGELRRQLACNARALVEQRYDWSAVRDSVHSAYAWL